MTAEHFRFLNFLTPEFNMPPQTLWAAPLCNQKNRMIAFSRDGGDRVFSSELYMNKDDQGGQYARINLRWADNAQFVNTMIAGPKEVIARYARHDHKLLLPDGLPHELSTLPIMKTLQENALWCYTRPSSFVCTRVELRMFQGVQLKIILLERVIGNQNTHEFFAHIHEAHEDETSIVLEKNGFIVSNSQTYIANHPEIQFEEVPFETRVKYTDVLHGQTLV